MSMSTESYLLSLLALIVVVGLVVAWESSGRTGRWLRANMRLLFWGPIYLAQLAIGLFVPSREDYTPRHLAR